MIAIHNTRKRSSSILIGVLLFLWVISCSPEDDVAAIRALIQDGAALAEDHDINGIMELTTEDIVAMPGAHSRLEIKRIIWTALMRYGQLKILYPKPSVDMSADSNQASCGIYLLIVKKDRVVPDVKQLYNDPKRWLETIGENADLYQLKLEMRKTDGRWLVGRAHLESFRGVGFSEGRHSIKMIPRHASLKDTPTLFIRKRR